MQYISVTELKAMKEKNENFVLLDVREDYELDICSIGGIHIPMAEVQDRVNEISKDHQVAVLCRSGKRAECVANLLVSDLNFSNVVIVEGGILAWIEQVDNQLEAY
ncbi:MAG: rhodanese-like domain-containing protein [Crocinitomicaceae bacterium]|jgi:rhodanese-related sulfurtransferase